MLNALRTQLTLLSAALTGAVLVVMALAALSLAEGQLYQGAESAFRSNANGIVVKLQTDPMVSATWLAQLEHSEGLIISIRDSGSPLSFRGSWTPATDRALLLARAEERSRALGVSPDSPPLSVIDTTSASFQVRGDHGEDYLGSVTLIPVSGGYMSLVLLKDTSDTRAQVLLLRCAFAALVLLGVAALCLLCWLFAGRAIRPVEEGRRRQAEFIAAASHELRSPLSVIRASASALAVAPTETAPLLGAIESECGRMARLVDDLLTLARSDAGSWSVRRETVDVDALLLEAAEHFSPLARQRGQTFLLKVPERDLPTVVGDAQRLSQVLAILLDNALCYTPEGGSITLSGCADRRTLTLAVSDTGPGIAPEQLPRIFDRFYRADAARTTKEHFGLGLSIARELVRLHNGALRVSRTGPDGTTFQLRLPIGSCS